MARPLPSGKQSVDLAAPVARVSRIRRDPPPPVKEVTIAEVKEREQWVVIVGIITFTAALFVILFAFSNWSGWSPGNHTIVIETSE